MLCKLLSVLCLFGLCLADGSKFKDCGSTVGSIDTLEIEPCDQSPCSLYKGENSTIRIKFKIKKQVKDATVSVHGIIAHVPIPFPLEDSNVCHFVQPSCPLTPENGPYTYEFKLLVQESYPSIKLTIRWEFKTDDRADIVCAEFPAQIVQRQTNMHLERVPMLTLRPAKRRRSFGPVDLD